MTYPETINFLFKQLPMFSRDGSAAIKEGLTNTIALCEALGNPQQKFKSIHIAGTNGKGSTSHMIASVLQHAGYKTGLYTSPHLKDFRERIKINGEMCSQDFVVRFTQKIQPFIVALQPSFFEITVAMAFDYFAEQQVDVAVIEVGLGGRLDSTNIIIPELSIITNIGLDHTHILGDTMAKIAFEKAGIIKHDVPVVIGELHPETKPVFYDRAQQLSAPIIFAEEKRYVSAWEYTGHQLHVTIADKVNDERKKYILDLPGVYQLKNIVTVLQALHQLKQSGWRITGEVTLHALAQVKKTTGLYGRWEILQQHPIIILDVAHNADGLKQVAEQIELSTFNVLHIVIGMVKDKDVKASLALLPKYARYYFTKAQLPRALPENELAAMAESNGLTGQAFATVKDALNAAKQHAGTEDMILVCGSVFVIAEVY
jgi:dihydrofolate synthase/folylpolyglutamate synthase